MGISSVFNSKVLLFGEYGVLLGADALSIPFNAFSGRFTFSDGGCDGGSDLSDFAKFLQSPTSIRRFIDVDSFSSDVDRGLCFQSNIPQGYGLGSSGALCAAVYSKYAYNCATDLKTLQNELAELEAFFHGKSSGFDPLVSYLNVPIYLKNGILEGELSLSDSMLNKQLFLVDTGVARSSSLLVKNFTAYIDTFENRGMKDMFLKLSNSCIAAYLQDKSEEMSSNFRMLSEFQLQNFTMLIPEKFLEVWKDGSAINLFDLKLCGAGGGGFLLGLTHHMDETEKYFRRRGLNMLTLS